MAGKQLKFPYLCYNILAYMWRGWKQGIQAVACRVINRQETAWLTGFQQQSKLFVLQLLLKHYSVSTTRKQFFFLVSAACILFLSNSMNEAINNHLFFLFFNQNEMPIPPPLSYKLTWEIASFFPISRVHSDTNAFAVLLNYIISSPQGLFQFTHTCSVHTNTALQ